MSIYSGSGSMGAIVENVFVLTRALCFLYMFFIIVLVTMGKDFTNIETCESSPLFCRRLRWDGKLPCSRSKVMTRYLCPNFVVFRSTFIESSSIICLEIRPPHRYKNAHGFTSRVSKNHKAIVI